MMSITRLEALVCVLAVSLSCAEGECAPAVQTLWVVLAVSLLLILAFFLLTAWIGAFYSLLAIVLFLKLVRPQMMGN